MTAKPLGNSPYLFLLIPALCLLSACQRYSFAINENVVYEPPPLFNAFQINDAALRKCVEGAIAEQAIFKAGELKKLACPPGNIQSLAGIETFDGLQQLGLAQNQLRNIEILGQLKDLRQLDLRRNQVVNFTTLKALQKLERIYTKGNVTADCATLPEDSSKLNIERPEHCGA
ncbi:Internalin-A [Thalassocella blandensis]|nr:Internalin-A [Thalassocella blandensis]